MLVIPAIDLQNGRCVRLWKGDFACETVYGDDPAEVARRWRDAGAELLHVVDLDGARQGRPVQLALIARLAVVAPLQVGGGLRTIQDVEGALAAGAERVVLGTAALDAPLMTELLGRWGERLVVALDTREGMVAVKGWTERSSWDMLDLAQTLRASGVQRFLHTDVARDGTLTRPNYASLQALIALGTPVIASGGVSSVDDVRQLRGLGAEAAIVGRALYEGTLDLQEAMLAG